MLLAYYCKCFLTVLSVLHVFGELACSKVDLASPLLEKSHPIIFQKPTTSESESSPRRALTSSTPLTAIDFHKLSTIYLVVSHCKQSVQWLDQITSIFNISDIMIFSKCGYSVTGAPVGARVRQLPNVGRCDHTYLHYIADELKAAEGVVLFLKDTTHVHNIRVDQFTGMNSRKTFPAMVKEAAGPSMFSCGQYLDPSVGISNEAISNYLLKYSLSKYNFTRSKVLYMSVQKEPFSVFSSMRAWTEALGVSLPQPMTPVCYGGIFAVNVKRLLSVDRGVWTRLRQSLARASNIEEGHFMERTWAGMLSLEAVAPPPEFLNRTALCFKNRYCGYRGHIVQSHVKENWRALALCPMNKSRLHNSINTCPPLSRHRKRSKRRSVKQND